MTYELERQQKERQAQFEAEMARRIEDLKVYNQFIEYTNHHSPHACFFSCRHNKLDGVPDKREDTHVPNSLDEWLHDKTPVIDERTREVVFD